MAADTKPSRGTTIALIVASAMFMQNLDSAIINTSLPKMALSFRVSTVDLSLGITAYMLASAAISPLASWLSDRFGARAVLAGSVLLFTLASVGCGMATNLPLFVIARLLQGTGGALMMPVGMEVVLRNVAKSELMQATALTVWPALVAPILGPVLGGFITQMFNWRWNFWLNLPIGLAGAIAVLICIPKTTAEHQRKLDLGGFALCSVALTCLLSGFQRSSVAGSARTMAIGLIAVGLAAGVMAVRHMRSSPAPLLALGPLSRTSFSHATLLPGALFRGMFSTAPFLLPLLFQLGFGLSPVQAGGWVLVYFAGNLGIKPVTTQILKSFGFRNVSCFNGGLVGLTMLACGFITPATPKLLLVVLLFAAGATRSMQMTSLMTLTFADIPGPEKSAASTLHSMLQQTATAAGVAAGAFLMALFAGLDHVTTVGLPELHRSFLAIGGVALAGAAVFWRMPADIGSEVSLHRLRNAGSTDG